MRAKAYQIWSLSMALLFIVIAMVIPIATIDWGESNVYPLPPGWSRFLTYYLASDYDYFYRFRILPLSYPFWMIVVITALLILAPRYSSLAKDLGISLLLSLYGVVAWELFVQFNFMYRSSYPVLHFPLTPLIGLGFVLISRLMHERLSRQESDSIQGADTVVAM
ncbi:MAG: hypothetical protein ACP6KW_09525 [Candidatus Thorarchaeota archaeon]